MLKEEPKEDSGSLCTCTYYLSLLKVILLRVQTIYFQDICQVDIVCKNTSSKFTRNPLMQNRKEVQGTRFSIFVSTRFLYLKS